MTLVPGTRFGAYDILASIGAGGMREVFRARDPKLDRQVALKILPPLFADDMERRARFEREARALAALNHSNIAQIYGVEEADGVVAIVMEHVAGEDLAARIARGPLTWTDARHIARQLAEGLDAAHERGIIHRDLKPANIRLTDDDTVKILDFGLAKAVAADESLSQDPALSPTFTSPSTRLGTIVGTAAYMAPEQAKGRAVDKRADVWAFGVVLFEMLTGRSPFASDSAAESIGLVVTKEPDWSALPASVPAHIVELLKRCLTKDPKARLRDIGDALHVLTGPDRRAEGDRLETKSGRKGVVIAASLGVALAIAAAALAWTLKPAAHAPLRQLDLPVAVAGAHAVALSPDGARIAYISEGRLRVRELAESDARDVAAAPPTTDNLAWSPDSATLAFYSSGSIRTVAAAGGPVFTVGAVPESGQVNGIVWDGDGSILVSVWRDSLYSMPASGGPARILVKINPDTEVDFHQISVGPRGRLIVGVHLRSENLVRTELVDPAAPGERTVLIDDPSVGDVRYAGANGLLFTRLGANQGVWTIPFAEQKLDLARSTVIAPGASDYSGSNEGTLLVRSEMPPTFTLEWRERDGSSTTIAGAPIAEIDPRIALSPEGNRLAYIAGRAQPALLVRDLTTGADTRLTVESSGLNVSLGSSFMLMNPRWFSGGQVLYAKGPIEKSALVVQRADGPSEPATLTTGSDGRVSANGQWLVWFEDDRGQGRLRYAALSGDRVGEAQTFPVTARSDVRAFDLSPDSRYLVYAVREPSGIVNTHLATFPDAAMRWQVTTGGGTFPRFTRDGRELVFFTGSQSTTGAPEGNLVSVPLAPGPPLKLGTQKILLTGSSLPASFDVGPDGRLLLVRRTPVRAGEDSRALLIQNWPLVARAR